MPPARPTSGSARSIPTRRLRRERGPRCASWAAPAPRECLPRASPASPPDHGAGLLPYEILARKRNGEALAAAELRAVVQGASEGGWSDGQLGAFLMAAAI